MLRAINPETSIKWRLSKCHFNCQIKCNVLRWWYVSENNYLQRCWHWWWDCNENQQQGAIEASTFLHFISTKLLRVHRNCFNPATLRWGNCEKLKGFWIIQNFLDMNLKNSQKLQSFEDFVLLKLRSIQKRVEIRSARAPPSPFCGSGISSSIINIDLKVNFSYWWRLVCSVI